MDNDKLLPGGSGLITVRLFYVGNRMNLIWDVFTPTPGSHVLVLRLSLGAEPEGLERVAGSRLSRPGIV
jgi:hypothetical protein